jgi:restriction endonuclease S subunit
MSKQKLPEGWKEIALGEICEVKKGSTITKAKVSEGDVPVIAGGQQPAYYHNLSNRVGKTITVSGSGAYAGFVAYFNIPIFASDCSTIQSKNKEVFLNYIYYFLKGNQKKIYDLQRGIAQPHVYPKDLVKIKIPLPPIPTQKKIVSILEKAEQLKQLRKEADELTKDFLKSVFYEMFGNPFDNKKKFEVKKVKEIVDLINGKAFKPSDWSKKGLRIIRIQNLNNPYANFNYFDGKVKNQYIVEEGDLLLSWSGTPGTSFGVFIWTGEKSVLNQHIFNVKIKEKTLNKIYFKYFINAKLMELISKAHGGVGLQHITKAELENVDFFLPPISLQNKFASIVKEVEAMKKQQKKSKEEINNLFNTLMQKAFKGELIQ